MSGATTTGTRIQGNYFGLTPDGTARLSGASITISNGASSIRLGGPNPGERNIIGVSVVEFGATGSGHQIVNNYFGLNVNGADLPGGGGITLGAANSTVRGNVFHSATIGGSGTVIQGNLIGLAANGVTALEGASGLSVSGTGNTVGGTIAADGNVIAASTAFTVRLNTVPSAVVTVGLASIDATEGAVSPPSLTFQPTATALNPQTVTVTGLDDPGVDGDVAYSVVTNAASSADPAYNGVNPPDVAVTNLDNDVARSAPRPNVQVTSVKGGTGFLNVTVQAGAGTISRIDFGTPRPVDNARVSVSGGVQHQSGAFSYVPNSPPATVQLIVQSPDRSRATTVPFTVADGCGTWQTFVGGGRDRSDRLAR